MIFPGGADQPEVVVGRGELQTVLPVSLLLDLQGSVQVMSCEVVLHCFVTDDCQVVVGDGDFRPAIMLRFFQKGNGLRVMHDGIIVEADSTLGLRQGLVYFALNGGRFFFHAAVLPGLLRRPCPVQGSLRVAGLIFHAGNLQERAQAKTLLIKWILSAGRIGLTGRILFILKIPSSSRKGLFLKFQPVHAPHEDARDLGQPAVVIFFIRTGLVEMEHFVEKGCAVPGIRPQRVHGDIRRHRVHGDRTANADQVKVAQAQQHVPQSARLKNITAEIHKKTAVDAAGRQQGQDAEKGLLVRRKDREIKETAQAGVEVCGAAAVMDLRVAAAADLFQYLRDCAEAGVVFEGGSDELDGHDVLADGQDDLLHHDFLVLRPDVPVINLHGKVDQFSPGQEMVFIGETDRRVLGRHPKPGRDQQVRPGPADQVQDLSVGPALGIIFADRAQHLHEGPVVMCRVEIVDDQEESYSVAGDPGEIEGEEVFRGDLFAGEPVLKADVRDRQDQVIVEGRVDADGIRACGCVPECQGSLAAAAVPADPDRTPAVAEFRPDPGQLPVPALEDPAGSRRPGDRRHSGQVRAECLPLLHLQDLDVLRQQAA